MNHVIIDQGNFLGTIWMIGWLFTMGFLGLTFWKGLLGLIVWPFYLGEHFSNIKKK